MMFIIVICLYKIIHTIYGNFMVYTYIREISCLPLFKTGLRNSSGTDCIQKIFFNNHLQLKHSNPYKNCMPYQLSVYLIWFTLTMMYDFCAITWHDQNIINCTLIILFEYSTIVSHFLSSAFILYSH